MIRAYTHHYQHGGAAIEVYRMPRRWQGGDGFGESVRSALRYIIPAVAGGAEKFGTEMLDRTEKGEKFGDAARHAIFPALMAAKDRALQRLEEKLERQEKPDDDQKGTGSRKRRKRVYKDLWTHKKKKSSKSTKRAKRSHHSTDSNLNF